MSETADKINPFTLRPYRLGGGVPMFGAFSPDNDREAVVPIGGATVTLIRKYLKFLPDAQAARGRSKDRSTQVGAVVIDDDFNVRISGYNGMPRGVDDSVEARHERPAKYLYFAHAEENCVAQAARVGVSLKGCSILLTSLFPCTACARQIIQSGIKRVLAPSQVDNTRWDEQGKVALEMLAEAGVEVLYYDVPA